MLEQVSWACCAERAGWQRYARSRSRRLVRAQDTVWPRIDDGWHVKLLPLALQQKLSGRASWLDVIGAAHSGRHRCNSIAPDHHLSVDTTHGNECGVFRC